MKTFARIEHQEVAEIVNLDVDPVELFHPSLTWIDITNMSPQPQVNYLYDNGIFTAPVFEIQEPTFIASFRQSSELEGATAVIAPLQDALDLGIATEDEKQKLTAWKTYRVQINRIKVSDAPNITWPEKPA